MKVTLSGSVDKPVDVAVYHPYDASARRVQLSVREARRLVTEIRNSVTDVILREMQSMGPLDLHSFDLFQRCYVSLRQEALAVVQHRSPLSGEWLESIARIRAGACSDDRKTEEVSARPSGADPTVAIGITYAEGPFQRLTPLTIHEARLLKRQIEVVIAQTPTRDLMLAPIGP